MRIIHYYSKLFTGVLTRDTEEHATHGAFFRASSEATEPALSGAGGREPVGLGAGVRGSLLL